MGFPVGGSSTYHSDIVREEQFQLIGSSDRVVSYPWVPDSVPQDWKTTTGFLEEVCLLSTCDEFRAMVDARALVHPAGVCCKPSTMQKAKSIIYSLPLENKYSTPFQNDKAPTPCHGSISMNLFN